MFNPLYFNLIPVDSKNKKPIVEWIIWQNNSIPKEKYDEWENKGLYRNAYGIITGQIHDGPSQGKYLVCIDIDNKKGIDEFLLSFTNLRNLTELSQITLVVQHEDALKERAHIYYITEAPIIKRSGIPGINKTKEKDPNLPAIEIKSDSSTYMVGPGSSHQNGKTYEIIGTNNILLLDEKETKRLDNAISAIYQKYSNHGQDQFKTNQFSINESSLSNELRSIARNFRMDSIKYKIHEGNRSNTLISFGRTLLNYNHQSKELENIKQFFFQVNEKLCDPPMSHKEIDSIWNLDVKYFYDDLKNHENNKLDNLDFVKDLCNKIPDKKFYEYLVKIAKKTVKQEDSLIRLVTCTGLSTFTNDPLNLGIMAPTSEGKTYAVNQIVKFFPKSDIWVIGCMSPKVIIRDKGLLVDENYIPIKGKIQELKKSIEHEKDEHEKTRLEKQLENLYENAKVLIDLTGKIFVFLEPPHKETWEILKPILSHDSPFIEHPYVYKNERRGQEVKHIVTKGWPACIFCSAKDESEWSMWPEIQSRFFITSPNMIPRKYYDSNVLIGQKKGLPTLVQEQVIVSEQEIQLAKDCILLIKDKLLKNFDSRVYIPFRDILSRSLPSEKGTDVRIANRMFSLLELITKLNAFSRPKLTMGHETLPVSTPLDLEEVLRLTHNLTGIPAYKLKFFTDIFIPCFTARDTPDRQSKNGGEFQEEEERIALTTTELAEYYKKITSKPITTDNLKKTFLIELKNNGLIDELDSKIDKRRKIYYPIVDISQFLKNKKISNYTNVEEIDNNLQFAWLKLSNNFTKIDENWLKIEILYILKYGIGMTNTFKLLDEDNKELCICQFIEKYQKYGDLKTYFQYDRNCIYTSKLFGAIKTI